MKVYSFVKDIDFKKLVNEIAANGTLATFFNKKAKYDGTTVEIEMSQELSNADENTLISIVTNHDPTDNSLPFSGDDVSLKSSGESATANVSWKSKTKIEPSNLELGDYTLYCYFEYRGLSPIVEVHFDGTRVAGTEGATEEWSSFSCEIPIDGQISGAHVAELLYKAKKNIKPTEIRNALIRLRRDK